MRGEQQRKLSSYSYSIISTSTNTNANLFDYKYEYEYEYDKKSETYFVSVIRQEQEKVRNDRESIELH